MSMPRGSESIAFGFFGCGFGGVPWTVTDCCCPEVLVYVTLSGIGPSGAVPLIVKYLRLEAE